MLLYGRAKIFIARCCDHGKRIGLGDDVRLRENA